ncbi:uncharacterized protein BKA55DRAFT_260263 [Fusarium redolens]|uniref:Uncharacterized protein n=1 Tax=Fusarium redolens TaxID=48865 RepID=A0A9P9FV49_FUSRE|nr:uncharacterized protein BKA55DRAFT_260263 [Fusarium redolens]KAH7210683.1 hypothetical protein BKA55DRAFT_260263 [Fusarium redolens]
MNDELREQNDRLITENEELKEKLQGLHSSIYISNMKIRSHSFSPNRRININYSVRSTRKRAGSKPYIQLRGPQ